MAERPYLVGVDIGSSAIKLCHLKDVRGQRTLVRFGYQPLPPRAIEDGKIKDPVTVISALERVFSENKVRRRDVALSVSGHSVIIKRITLPLLSDAELREQINWEASQQIPFDINDVAMDYEVLRRHADQGQMDVLLVAAKKDDLNEAVELARKAKLRPVVIDVDAFSVQNAFEVNYGLPSEGTVALVNVGATLSTVNILNAGIPAFTRDIATGGNAFTDDVMKQVGVSFDEAERFKIGGVGVPVPAEVAGILQASAESLAGEIQRSLDFYLATSGEREISHIYLAGGTSNVQELLEAIQRRARTVVERMDPLRQIAVDPKDVDHELLRAHAAQATVALGLALRREREAR